MRIVRPYGESRTAFQRNTLRRALHLRDQQNSRREIETYSTDHPELVIAQWISIIDKIATKPAGQNGATPEQKSLRDRLGQAAWDQMTGSGRLMAPEAEFKRLKTLWQFKVHPYGEAPYRPRKKRDGTRLPDPNPRGRWFSRFAGAVEPEAANAAEIAQAIEAHLYSAAKRLHPQLEDRDTGLIEARARSIAGNTVSLAEERADKNRIPLPASWDTSDEATYFRVDDIAATIHADAVAHEETSNRPYHLSAAAKLLERHWRRLFGEKVTRFREVPEEKRGLLVLHLAVKEVYRTKLKRRTAPVRSKKDTRRTPKLSPASQILPKRGTLLLNLVTHIRRNRELADLIRRGKLIHYTAGDLAGGADTTTAPLRHWVADLSASRFRTSDGQAAIKRAEAFVRIWRHTIALSSLTLRDWASMKRGDIGDVYGSSSTPGNAIADENFDVEAHDRKSAVILGNRAGLFQADDAARKALLASLIRTGIALRNSGFHFSGRVGFLNALRTIADPGIVDPATLRAAQQLWEDDARGRGARLRAALIAVKADRFFDATQAAKLVGLLEAPSSDGDLPLPRFRRVLLRAENAWKGKDHLDLPQTANRTEMEEQPGRRCQYVVLKELYEGPFRAWLAKRGATDVTGWIERAIARSTRAAQDLNAGKDQAKRSIIEARAAALLKERSWELRTFMIELSRSTASEMQVQKGYGHDGEAAREQAGYIEDVLCDVLAMAFETWLTDTELGFVRDLDPRRALPDDPLCDIEQIPTAAEIPVPAAWEAALYLFLHLVPVGDVGRLLHQLAKWEITASLKDPLSADETDRLAMLNRTLVLYLDMHDAKFEGGTALTGIDAFRDLFASWSGFSRVFPAQVDDMLDRRVPRRGLREIMRFGHRGLLQEIGGQRAITDKEVDDYLKTETGTGEASIAALQRQRETEHGTWVEQKKIAPKELRLYAEAVRDLAQHRQLAARVTLADQVELHRLMMTVLGRLVDYTGLFERDLYFAMLGLLHRDGLQPASVFSGRAPGEHDDGEGGLSLIASGQMFAALNDRNLRRGADGAIVPQASHLQSELQRLFGDPAGRSLLDGRMSLRSLRNEFAHFNWLHMGGQPLNLTRIISDARVLMSYDRKLENAVTKSIKELLARDGIDLTWRMKNHVLSDAKVASRQAVHLGGRTVFHKAARRRTKLFENLKSPAMLASLAQLFGGALETNNKDVTHWDFRQIDWSPPQKRTGRAKHKPHPGSGKKHHAKPRKNRSGVKASR